MDVGSWIEIILIGVGAFSAIAVLTPNKTDNKIAQVFLDFINAAGMNFGKAENHPGGTDHPDSK